MTAAATRPAFWGRSMRDRGKWKRESHWTEGRRIAIFPDVPGSDFKPEHSLVITTDRRRELVGEVVTAIFNRLKSGEDNRPEWLMAERHGRSERS